MAKPTTTPRTRADAFWSVAIGALAGTIVLLRFQGGPWWLYVGLGVVVAIGAYVGDFG